MAVSISPWLVPSRSPWNRLSMVIRPTGAASPLSAGWGVTCTSNVPVARALMCALSVLGGFETEQLHRLVLAGAGQPPAVGTERHRPYIVRVLGEGLLRGAVLDPPEADGD